MNEMMEQELYEAGIEPAWFVALTPAGEQDETPLVFGPTTEETAKVLADAMPRDIFYRLAWAKAEAMPYYGKGAETLARPLNDLLTETFTRMGRNCDGS